MSRSASEPSPLPPDPQRPRRTWPLVATVAVTASAATAGLVLLVMSGAPDDTEETDHQAVVEVEPEPEPEPAAEEPPPEEPEDDADVEGIVMMTPAELARRFGDAVYRVEVTGCGLEASGSAFAIDDHHLVTNHHVVEVDLSPRLVGRDGRQMSGEVIGWRVRPDVAVIRVPEPLPVHLAWAPTDELSEGETIVTLGYPVPGRDFTVTPGSILSFEELDGRRHAIRSDAALDRGNSGGPSLDAQGRVAGVVTQMADNSSGFQNIPLLFTHDALGAVVDAIRGAPEPPAQVICAGSGMPNPLPEGWEAEGPGPEVDGYGDDPILDALWDACDDGDMHACDELWRSSPFGSLYEYFADTCGERNEPAGWCSVLYEDDATGLPSVLTLDPGLFCQHLEDDGYAYADAIVYWWLEGMPDRMDASGNGIPCQTIYPANEVQAFWGLTDVETLPSGLFCADLYAWGYSYAEAVDYWEREGRTPRMDASGSGIPCETVYPAGEIAGYWS